MGIRFYDQALLKKLHSWVKDTSATILGPGDINRVFQIMADKKNDKEVTLPLIILSRDENVTINNNSKRPLTYDGAQLILSSDNETSVKLNAIPITLNYQIDVVTKYYEEADEYIRNFVFNLINYPKVTIDIPYNGVNLTHNSSITLDPNIADNTTNPQRLFPGQLSDWTLRFTIDNAYLFSVPFVQTWSFKPPIQLDVKQNDEYYSHEYIDYEK